MALINKIREKSGWAVGAIAIGLGVFVVGGDLLGPNSRLLGNDANTVGEIAGEEIDFQEFDLVLQQVKADYENRVGRAANEGELAMLREQAWNQLIFKIALQKEYDRLGLEVTEDELADMVQGNNIHPAVRQAFTNPQTGEFDRNQVVQYLQNLDQMGPEARPMWVNFEQNILSDRLQSKYANLLNKTVYITSAEAKNFYKAQNAAADLKVLYVPFFTVSDSAVQVTDAQLQDYYNRNKERYKVEAGRSVEYVTIPVAVSKEDSTYYKEEFANITQQFANANNDSVFVNINSDVPFDGTYRTPGELPEQLRKQLPLQEGQVYGPYTENGATAVYKVTDAKESDKSALRASHILIRPENDTPEAKAAAKAKAQDILSQIKGGADFAKLAAQHGSDGTAAAGGDLGWFPEGQMVPAFEEAVFGFSGTGVLPNLVETEYGYHIIKVTEPKTNQTYQVAAVQRVIEPSETSRDAAYTVADQLAGTSGNLEEFRENVTANEALVREEAKNIGKNNVLVNNLNNARELVRWAYAQDTEVGDVSPVFEIDDQFVVAVLTGEREKGYASIEDVRDELTAAVRNEVKAEQIIAKLKGQKGSLDQIAASYGSDAMVRTADNVTFASGTIPGLGVEPVAVGKAFGLKPGARTAPFEGQGGVMIVELVALDEAPEINDLSNVKQQLVSTRSNQVTNNAFEAIKEKADIKDNRVRFF
ncbi:peptidyl-prolyl cis-trans isomerase D [Pontibacter ummariensis]|uniref:Periplasmic chaperone PpiD n=1 Tax=Pontibacter ummariensis TaxID=1610492 RepID=A0A239CHD2_9BACT|nr:peptidylprolyl isomerase [Pontibacter ummariensis]PRY15044.1 peptidyl-prolyl cis-trans isomerase D [Pontibacter ummariensis]SNS18884.1 peptidyl-prolyl cis-trans isomerase D [Pontibacter ummariensis]